MALSENREKQLSNSENRPDLVYLSADVGSVFEAQVIALLSHYQIQNRFKTICLVCGVKSDQEKERVHKIINGKGFKVLFFRNRPNYIVFHAAQKREIAKALAHLPESISEPIIHVRGELLAFHAAAAIIKKWGTLNRVLVDIRGAGWEEVQEFQKTPPILKLLKKSNHTQAFKSLRKFGAVSVVSEALKHYVAQRTGNMRSAIHVIPCLVPDNFGLHSLKRTEIRKELGLSQDDKLFVFSSGGNAGWQQNELLKELISDRWRILNLSLTPIDAEGVINRFVRYADIPDYLAAADAAVIFRSDSIVNQVACPVKFCEYLCSGLPVIANHSVHLIQTAIAHHELGVLIAEPAQLHQIPNEAIFDFDREKIADYGNSVFGIEAVAEKYQTIYSMLK